MQGGAEPGSRGSRLIRSFQCLLRGPIANNLRDPTWKTFTNGERFRQLTKFQMSVSVDQSRYEQGLSQVDVRRGWPALDNLDHPSMANYQLSWVEQATGCDETKFGLDP